MRGAILILLLGLTGTAQAEIYKCTDANGRMHFRDQPCVSSERAAPYDPAASNVTTIDSESSRREMLGALVTREEIREQHIEVTTPASSSSETQIILSRPGLATEPYDDGAAAYPAYPYVGRGSDHRGRGHRHRRDDDNGHRGPRPSRQEEAPIVDPSRGTGRNTYAPPPPTAPVPPTIRQLAPRSPSASSPTAAGASSSSTASRGSGARSSSSRDDER